MNVYERLKQQQREAPELDWVALIHDGESVVCSNGGRSVSGMSEPNDEVLECLINSGLPAIDFRSCGNSHRARAMMPLLGPDHQVEGPYPIPATLAKAPLELYATIAQRLGATLHHIAPVNLHPGMLRKPAQRDFELLSAVTGQRNLFDFIAGSYQATHQQRWQPPQGAHPVCVAIKHVERQLQASENEQHRLGEGNADFDQLLAERAACNGLESVYNNLVYVAWKHEADLRLAEQGPDAGALEQQPNFGTDNIMAVHEEAMNRARAVARAKRTDFECACESLRAGGHENPEQAYHHLDHAAKVLEKVAGEIDKTLSSQHSHEPTP